MASIDSHQGDCANDQETHQQVIKIDPDGDLTLVVGRTRTRFLVCSKALSRSARFWKRCLYGQFKEAKPAGDQDWVVEFPEDNPSAMKYVLLLVHGLGHRLPDVNLQLAFEVTVLTNKYDMTRALWAVARSWVDDLAPMPPGESDDDTIVPQLKWLWVTKELGSSEKHVDTLAELSQIVSTTTEGDTHLLLRPNELFPKTTLTRESLEGYEAEKDVIFLLTDEIMIARQIALSEIQKVLKRDIKTLRDAIKTFDSSKGCMGASICTGRKPDGCLLTSNKRRAAAGGHLQDRSRNAMAQANLVAVAVLGEAIVTKISACNYSSVTPITKISMSVEYYVVDAYCFTSRIEKEIGLVSGHDHKHCTPFRSDLPSHSKLELLTRSAWWRKNDEAFKAQARVSGLEKGEDGDDNEDQEAASPDSAARKRSRDEFEAAASA